MSGEEKVVKIRNLQRGIKVNQRAIKRAGEETLRIEGRAGKVDRVISGGLPLTRRGDQGCPAPAEVSIILVTDNYIRDLNRKYRGVEKATDVLAFPMQEGEFSGLHPHLLGDVVISVERAEKQAGEFRHGFEEELSLLTIHGILHLLGYNDITLKGRKKMESRQKEILEEVK